MLVTWPGLLALALLAGHGNAKSCKPDLQQIGCPAFQSSDYRYASIGSADKAVDGKCDGVFDHSSCSHTESKQEPWWYMDLEDQYAVSTVVVKNRQDCCGERLQGAQIRVGDSVADHGRPNPLFGTITDTSPGSVNTFYCSWLKGHYVSIHIPGQAEYLTLCEVEVYGARQCY